MEDDQDDYFEKMYADELEIMKEQEMEESAWLEEMANQYEENKQKEPRYKSKRSLDFSKCGGPENLSISPTNQLSTDVDHVQIPVRTSKKRFPENPAEELSSTPSKRARILSAEETAAAVAPSRKSRIPKNDFISVTGSDGTIIYVDVADASKKVSDVGRKKSQLLATPLTTLKMQIFEEVLLKGNASNLQSSESEAAAENGFVEAYDNVERGKDNSKLLWVDKYSPQSYSDLISEEATNRSLLKWLKLWDFTTFGIEPKMVETQKEKLGKKFQKNVFKKDHGDLVPSDLDKNKRPVHKVALISGPPGFGKTTLAHIIAKHAGYNVVEMNASDDRGVEVFREKIEAATQMRAVIGDENPRPNCLVIDEIDGAPQPAIEVLINMIKKSDPSGSSNPSSKSTGRKKKDATLLRPVICICNDLYVPALRQLRQLCFLVYFHAPHTSNLTGRLMEISKLENINADTSALNTLCEKAENDIRSCINTLQFIKSKGSGELKADMVSSLSLGQKDFQRSLFSNWISIFTLPKPVKPKYIDPNDRDKIPEFWTMGKKAVTTSERFRNILQLMSSSDEAKLHQGLFENYLTTNIKDPRMNKIGEAIDWLCDSDLLEVQISKHQDYSMMRYKPFVSVLFHLLFAVNRPNKITFPKANFEFQSALSRSKEILLTFLQGCPASVQSCTSLEKSVLSTIPYMSHIIQPSLRPVNIHLYSTHEKNSLAQVVKTMMLYGLSYRQEKNEEGQFIYVLEPSLEKLLRFSDTKFQKTMSYSCRQMIAREIELERLRRSEGTEPPRDSHAGKKQDVPKSKPKEMVQRKPVKDAKGPVDFFGRRIEKPTVSAAQDKDSLNGNQDTPTIFGQVWYKYKEGFSNAVKRSCKVKDFL